jgi:hypothetical protein
VHARARDACAARIPAQAGTTLIACNYRCRIAELDLVARRHRLLCRLARSRLAVRFDAPLIDGADGPTGWIKAALAAVT